MCLFGFVCDCETLFVRFVVFLLGGLCFSDYMCLLRVGCTIFFRLHIYLDFYDYYIVFGSVVWQRPTFYGCFVWLCLFEPICQEVTCVCH